MSPSGKLRLDQLLFQRGLAESRTRAQALILAGKVVVGDHRVDKPGTHVSINAEIRVKEPDHPFVSRGGVKLAGALDAFELDVSSMIALDVGASTGGFTDCLLQRGATRVIALDVGRAQLHNKLRQDPRVCVYEGVNARHLGADALEEKVDLVVFDLSFISLNKVLEPVLAHIKPEGKLVVLVKPQFELGKGEVGKGGIVRQEHKRKEAVDAVASFARSLGLSVLGRATSVLPGHDGNIEVFLFLGKGPA